MKRKVAVLGGGVGGLAAGWMLARTGGYDVTVVERAQVTGGVCGTFEYDGFLLDYGPHKSYSTLPGILDELKDLVGDEFLRHEKRNCMYLCGGFARYPVSIVDLATKIGLKNFLQTGASAAAALARRNKVEDKRQSYEEYVVSRFGRKTYELVFGPLADKTWGDPATLSADIARARIPGTGALDLALRAVGARRESALTDAKHFYYPRLGFGRLPQRMQEEIVRFGGKILTRSTPTRILRTGRRITGVEISTNGDSLALPCDLLVSTVPLDCLATLLGGDGETDTNDALRAARKLQYRTAFLVYVFLRRDMITDYHWLFFPERNITFGRVFEQKRMSQDMGPKGRTVLCCDFTDYEDGLLYRQSDRDLAGRCVADLEKTEIIQKSWVDGSLVVRLPRFYPRYDLSYKEIMTQLGVSLKSFENLLSTGRIGFYNYNNSDHCVDMGKFIADGLDQGKSTGQIWTELEQRVADYRIVD